MVIMALFECSNKVYSITSPNLYNHIHSHIILFLNRNSQLENEAQTKNRIHCPY